MIAATLDWRIDLTIGVVLVVAMVLAYRILHRDPNIRRTRFGLFVERDRFDGDEAELEPETLDEPTVGRAEWPKHDGV